MIVKLAKALIDLQAAIKADSAGATIKFVIEMTDDESTGQLETILTVTIKESY